MSFVGGGVTRDELDFGLGVVMPSCRGMFLLRAVNILSLAEKGRLGLY